MPQNLSNLHAKNQQDSVESKPDSWNASALHRGKPAFGPTLHESAILPCKGCLIPLDIDICGITSGIKGLTLIQQQREGHGIVVIEERAHNEVGRG